MIDRWTFTSQFTERTNQGIRAPGPMKYPMMGPLCLGIYYAEPGTQILGSTTAQNESRPVLACHQPNQSHPHCRPAAERANIVAPQPSSRVVEHAEPHDVAPKSIAVSAAERSSFYLASGPPNIHMRCERTALHRDNCSNQSQLSALPTRRPARRVGQVGTQRPR